MTTSRYNILKWILILAINCVSLILSVASTFETLNTSIEFPTALPTSSPTVGFASIKIAGFNDLITYSGDGGLATEAGLRAPLSLVVDTSSNVYFIDSTNVGKYFVERAMFLYVSIVRNVSSSTNIINTYVGNGQTLGYSGDGNLAIYAELQYINNLALDSKDNLYLTDSANCVIRRVSKSSGIISTYAGLGPTSCLTFDIYSTRTLATQAGIGYTQGLAFDSENNLYFGSILSTENTGYGIYLVNSQTGIITLYSGSGRFSCSIGSVPEYKTIASLAIDSQNKLFVADSGCAYVVKTDSISGSSLYAGVNLEGRRLTAATSVSLSYQINDIKFDSEDNLFISDGGNNLIYEIDSSSQNISVFAGLSTTLGPATGYTETLFPRGIFIRNDQVYVSSIYGHSIIEFIKVTPTDYPTFTPTFTPTIGDYTASIIAGDNTAEYRGDGGLAVNALTHFPLSIVVDSSNNVYFVDSTNVAIEQIDSYTFYVNVVRKIDSDGIIDRYVGNGLTVGYSGDGKIATNAELQNIQNLVLDSNDNLYFADSSNCAVRTVNKLTGVISTYAGAGPVLCNTLEVSSILATEAGIGYTRGLAFDSLDNLYIGSLIDTFTGGYGIYLVNSTTKILTLFSGSGLYSCNVGYSPSYKTISALAINSYDVLFVADEGCNYITEIIGTQSVFFAGDSYSLRSLSQRRLTDINYPRLTFQNFSSIYDMKFDDNDNLYISDSYERFVYVVYSSSDKISLFAGYNNPSFLGSAYSSDFFPAGIYVSKTDVYIACFYSHFVLELSKNLPTMVPTAAPTNSFMPTVSPTAEPTPMPTVISTPSSSAFCFNFHTSSNSLEYSLTATCYQAVDYDFYVPAGSSLQYLDNLARAKANDTKLSIAPTECLESLLKILCTSIYLKCVPGVKINDTSTWSNAIYSSLGLTVPLPYQRPCVSVCYSVNSTCLGIIPTVFGFTIDCSTKTDYTFGLIPRNLPLTYDFSDNTSICFVAGDVHLSSRAETYIGSACSGIISGNILVPFASSVRDDLAPLLGPFVLQTLQDNILSENFALGSNLTDDCLFSLRKFYCRSSFPKAKSISILNAFLQSDLTEIDALSLQDYSISSSFLSLNIYYPSYPSYSVCLSFNTSCSAFFPSMLSAPNCSLVSSYIGQKVLLYPKFNQTVLTLTLKNFTLEFSSAPDEELSAVNLFSPTQAPSVIPSSIPTKAPSNSPSSAPTISPSSLPSSIPTAPPSREPSFTPTVTPTNAPSRNPSLSPSNEPTIVPSAIPSNNPSIVPTIFPSSRPSSIPTTIPSREPSFSPSLAPTDNPSHNPTLSPSSRPSSIPTTIPSREPSFTPTLAPTNNPSHTPTLSPSNKSTSIPTIRPSCFPSFAPSILPSILPSSSPSFSPEVAKSQFPTRLPTGKPSLKPNISSTVAPSTLPTCVPSSIPSFRPSSLRTARPTTFMPIISLTVSPTSVPTSLELLPNIRSIMGVSSSNISLTYRITIFSQTASAGVLTCGASTSGSESFVPLSFQTQVSFLNTTSPVSITISGLRPVQLYFIYCSFVISSSGFQSAVAMNSSSTSCCIYVPFINAPTHVFGDLSLYSPSVPQSLFLFQYSILYPPKVTLNVTVFITPFGDSDHFGIPSILPKSQIFEAGNPSLHGSFILSGTSSSSGLYKISLTVSGSLDYKSTSALVNVIPTNIPFRAPIITTARFADNGASVYVLFNTPTDLAGTNLTIATCDRYFEFINSNLTTCFWANSSALQISFGNLLSGIDALKVNDVIKLAKGVKIRSKCISGQDCEKNSFINVTSTQIFVEPPLNGLKPSASLIVPGDINDCFTSLIVDASQSTGSGGRRWRSVNWVVTDSFGDLIESAMSFLNTNSVFRPISIPRHVLLSRDTTSFNFNLTLVNFFGISSNTISTVNVRDINTPVITVIGGNSAVFNARDIVAVSAIASASTCSGSSAVITYSQTVLNVNKIPLPSVKSISSDRRIFKLPSYTLSPGQYYIVFSATSPSFNGSFNSTSTAVVSLVIQTGNVNAIVRGGSTRVISRRNSLSLDASSSYDEGFSDSLELTFRWSCTLASLTNFGSTCNNVFDPSTVSSSIAIIPSFNLSASSSYIFRVTVISKLDVRSDSTVVFVNTLSDSVQDLTSSDISSTSTTYNNDKRINIDATVFGNVDSNAFWSVYYEGNSVGVTTLTPTQRNFSESEVLQGIKFPISISASSLIAGSRYTLRLSTRPINAINHISYSQITISINSPPSSGIISVSPNSGFELITQFTISAQGWISTLSSGYPLQYVFSYSVSYADSELYLGTRRSQSYVNTILPSGLESNKYAVTLFLVIYDSFNASSVATTSANVYSNFSGSNLQTTLNALNYLNTTSSSAFASLNVENVVSTVNAIGSSSRFANCSIANTSFCSAYNRQPCFDVPNTCGPCLSGFQYGAPGSFNSFCSNSSSFKSTSKCSENKDCFFNLCVNGSCTVPNKQCSNDCSGRGSCTFTDASNEPLESCLLTNTYCTAKCSCESGYSGVDCSFESTSRDDLRYLLCDNIVKINDQVDSTGDTLATLIGSLKSSFSAYEAASLRTQLRCIEALQAIVLLSRDGLLTDIPSTFTTLLVDTMSLFIESDIFRTLSESNVKYRSLAQNLTDLMLTGILATTVEGASAIDIASDFLQITSLNQRVSDINGFTFSPPKTQSGNAYNSPTQSIEVLDGGLNQCNLGNGYQKTSITQFSRNPVFGKNDINTKSSPINQLIHFFRQSESVSTSRRLSLQSSSNSQENIKFFINLQFNSQQSFTRNGTVSNQTVSFPACREYDEVSGNFVSCSGCTVVSYTDFSMTIGCTNNSLLCSSVEGSSRRLATSSESPRLLDSTSSIIGAVVDTFAFVLSGNPFQLSSIRAIGVISFVSILALLILIGSISFIHWDRLDHDYVIYVKRDEKLVKYDQYIKSSKTKNSADVGSKHAINRNFKPRDSLSGHKYDRLKRISTYFGFSKSERFVKLFLKDVKSTRTTQEESVKTFLDNIFQTEYILNDNNLFSLFSKALLKHHVFMAPFFGFSLRNRRIIRWTSMTYSMLVNIFVNTLFFQTFFADNNYCEKNNSKESCLLDFNEATNQPTCKWTIDMSSTQGGICSLNPPPQTVVFIVIVGMLTVIIFVPLKLSVDFLLREYCSRRPDLELLGIPGLSSPFWFGSVTGQTNNSEHPEDETSDREIKNRRDVIYNSNSAPTIVPKTELTSKTIPFYRSPSKTKKTYIAPSTLQDIINTSEEAMLEYMSPEEEADKLIESVKNFLTNKSPQCFIPWIDANGSDALRKSTANKYEAKLNAIVNHLNINPDGSAQPLTLTQCLYYSNPYERLVAKLSSKRLEMEKLKTSVENISNDASKDPHILNMYILQTFILEQVPVFKKFCLRGLFYHYDEVSPEGIEPWVWIGSWAFVIGTFGFYLYWILSWATLNQGNTVYTWAWIFAVSQAQDIFIVQFLRVYVLYVATLQATRPQLKDIYRVLTNVSLRLISDDESEGSHFDRIFKAKWSDDDLNISKDKTMSTNKINEGLIEPISARMMESSINDKRSNISIGNLNCVAKDLKSVADPYENLRIVQYLSPSCRLAKQSTYYSLFSSAILRSIDDLDAQNCISNYNRRLGFFVVAFISIPVILSIIPGVGKPMTNMFLGGLLPAMSSAFITANSQLYDSSSIGLIVFYAIIGWQIVWQFAISKPSLARRRMKQNKIAANNAYSLPKYLLPWIDGRRVTFKSKLLDFVGEISFVLSFGYITQRFNKYKEDMQLWKRINQMQLPSKAVNENTNSAVNFVSEQLPESVKNMFIKSVVFQKPEIDPSKVIRELSVGFNYKLPYPLYTRADFDNFVEERSIFQISEVKNSLASEYRSSYITDNAEEALRRLANNLESMPSDQIIQNPDIYSEDNKNLEQEQTKYYTVNQYCMALDNIWMSFHPFYICLSNEEKDEVLHALIEWVNNLPVLQQSDVKDSRISFIAFRSWFFTQCRLLVKSRQYHESTTQFYSIRFILPSKHSDSKIGLSPSNVTRTYSGLIIQNEPIVNVTESKMDSIDRPPLYESDSFKKSVRFQEVLDSKLSPRPSLKTSLVQTNIGDIGASAPTLLSPKSKRSLSNVNYETYYRTVYLLIQQLRNACVLSSMNVLSDNNYSYSDLSIILHEFIFRNKKYVIPLDTSAIDLESIIDSFDSDLIVWLTNDELVGGVSLESFVSWLCHQCQSLEPNPHRLSIALDYDGMYEPGNQPEPQIDRESLLASSASNSLTIRSLRSYSISSDAVNYNL